MFRDFRLRSFVSISAFLFFLLMVISGAVAYIKPEGSIASWQFWSLLGLGKGEWEELHTLAGIFFLLLSVIHILLNWKVLCQYFKESSFRSRELILGILLLLFVAGSSIRGIPPLSLFMDAGEYLSDAWGREGSPPFSRAERKTLIEFCQSPEIAVPLAAAEERLEEAGVVVDDPSSTLEELASKNRVTPLELHLIISGEAKP